MAFGDEVGIFENVPDSEYHALRIPSASSIKKYMELPALFELEYLKGEYKEELKQHFQVGKAFEIYVLEPHRSGLIMQMKTKGYDTKDAAAMAEANPGAILLNEQDLVSANRWAACMLKRYPKKQTTRAQVSCIVDIDYGDIVVRAKIRIDELDDEEGVIIDYKLMDDASPKGFEKKAWDLKYHIQDALYVSVMNILAPRADGSSWRFVFRVQEKHYFGFDPRFAAQYELDNTSREAAISQVNMMLQLMGDDMRRNEFQGYQEATMQISTERFRKWA